MKLKIAVAIALVFNIVIISSILLINLYQQQTSQPAENTETSLPAYTREQIAQHNRVDDCWIIIQRQVYDVSSFINLHPGGAARIIPYCGQDATNAFDTQGGEGQHSNTAKSQLDTFIIGKLNL